MDPATARANALRNLTGALRFEQCFPHNVFAHSWSAFRFFDCDRMFEATFVEVVQELLVAEDAELACLAKLDAEHEPPVFMDAQTRPEVYTARLHGPGVADGWIYDMSRFACTSCRGEWAFYCERQSEIAVLALRSPIERFASAVERLGAMAIDRALEAQIAYAFSDALLPQWRRALLAEYPA